MRFRISTANLARLTIAIACLLSIASLPAQQHSESNDKGDTSKPAKKTKKPKKGQPKQAAPEQHPESGDGKNG